MKTIKSKAMKMYLGDKSVGLRALSYIKMNIAAAYGRIFEKKLSERNTDNKNLNDILAAGHFAALGMDSVLGDAGLSRKEVGQFVGNEIFETAKAEGLITDRIVKAESLNDLDEAFYDYESFLAKTVGMLPGEIEMGVRRAMEIQKEYARRKDAAANPEKKFSEKVLRFDPSKRK